MIGGIGNTNFDLWASGQRPQNYYMLGSMGLTIPIAVGVAMAQPQRHVLAIEGDGSLLDAAWLPLDRRHSSAEEYHDHRLGQRHLSNHWIATDGDSYSRSG